LISDSDIRFISGNFGVPPGHAGNVVRLLQEGMSVPFISRYRKEQTGNMDEALVNLISERYDLVCELNQRKGTILKTIEQQGKLSDELKDIIAGCYSPAGLEDIYLPFKPKKRTKAVIAAEMGLRPLADMLLDPGEKGAADELAGRFLTTLNSDQTATDALEWAGYIIAESFSENTILRSRLREQMYGKGLLVSEVKKDFREKRTKFDDYYQFSEPVKKIPAHRVHAVFRCE